MNDKPVEVVEQKACISCGNKHTERFCPDCGEVSGLRKITFRSVIEESLSTFVNMDRGFLYNLRALTFSPQLFIEDYLSGRRRGIFNPISYLIISISAYLILENFFPVGEPAVSAEGMRDTTIFKIGFEAGTIITDYFKFFWFVSIFLLALPSAFIFSKKNYAEHVTIAAFIIGHATLLVAFLTPIINVPLIFNYVLYSLIFILYYRFYSNPKDKFGSFLISFLVVILFFVELFLFTIFLGTISYFLF